MNYVIGFIILYQILQKLISIKNVKKDVDLKKGKDISNNEEDDSRNYIRRERIYGSYERSFTLGDLDQDSISASFNDGTLVVVVPKKEVADNKKVIEIA